MHYIRVFGWYGGKIRVVHKLGFLIPKHKYWFEPFMGSAALTLNHRRSEIEVINDLDPELVCFFRTLIDREQGKELVECLCNLNYGREIFEEAMQHKKNKFRGLSDIEKAVQIYVLISQSYNCTRKSFGNKGYKDTYAYRQSIKKHLPQAYARLKHIKVLSMDGIQLCEKVANNPDAFLFLDPPYREELRGEGARSVYACELPHSEQIRLLKTIRHAQCKIMLCGYKQPEGVDLYDTYLLPHGWHCYKLADLVKSCQNKEERDIGKEYIWVNYELPPLARYIISMKEDIRI